MAKKNSFKVLLQNLFVEVLASKRSHHPCESLADLEREKEPLVVSEVLRPIERDLRIWVVVDSSSIAGSKSVRQLYVGVKPGLSSELADVMSKSVALDLVFCALAKFSLNMSEPSLDARDALQLDADTVEDQLRQLADIARDRMASPSLELMAEVFDLLGIDLVRVSSDRFEGTSSIPLPEDGGGFGKRGLGASIQTSPRCGSESRWQRDQDRAARDCRHAARFETPLPGLPSQLSGIPVRWSYIDCVASDRCGPGRDAW